MKHHLKLFGLMSMLVLSLASCGSDSSSQNPGQSSTSPSSASVPASENWNAEYKSKGLGRSINLLDSSKYYFQYMSGICIFDDAKMSQLMVEHIPLKKGEVKTVSTRNIQEALTKNNEAVTTKLGLNFPSLGSKSLIPQKKSSVKVSYHEDYEKTTKSNTDAYFYNLSNYWHEEEICFANWKLPSKFVNALSDDFLSEATSINNQLKNNPSEETENRLLSGFISTFGTHFITSAVLGSSIELSYSCISNDRSAQSINGSTISGALHLDTSYVDFDASVTYDVTNSVFANSKNNNVSLNIEFFGGNNTGFFVQEDNLSQFGEGYKNWVASTVDENKKAINTTVVDFADNSLYCVWEVLSDEFQLLKTKLYDYFAAEAGYAYKAMMDKIGSFYSSDLPAGTAEDPFLISEPADMELLRNYATGDYYFELDENIDMTGVDFEPIPEFRGHLNGNGKTISNLSITKAVAVEESSSVVGACTAFIGSLVGTIEDVKFDHCLIEHHPVSLSTTTISNVEYCGIIGLCSNLVSRMSVHNSTFRFRLDSREFQSLNYLCMNFWVGAIAYNLYWNNSLIEVSDCVFDTNIYAKNVPCFIFGGVGAICGGDTMGSSKYLASSHNTINTVIEAGGGGYLPKLDADVDKLISLYGANPAACEGFIAVGQAYVIGRLLSGTLENGVHYASGNQESSVLEVIGGSDKVLTIGFAGDILGHNFFDVMIEMTSADASEYLPDYSNMLINANCLSVSKGNMRQIGDVPGTEGLGFDTIDDLWASMREWGNFTLSNDRFVLLAKNPY